MSIIGAGNDKGAAYSFGAHKKHWLSNTLVFHVPFTFRERIAALCAVCCFNCRPERSSWRGDVPEDVGFLQRDKQPYSVRR